MFFFLGLEATKVQHTTAAAWMNESICTLIRDLLKLKQLCVCHRQTTSKLESDTEGGYYNVIIQDTIVTLNIKSI